MMSRREKNVKEIFHRGTPTIVICFASYKMLHIFSYVFPYQQLFRDRLPGSLFSLLNRELVFRNKQFFDLKTKIQCLPYGPLKQLIRQDNELAVMLVYAPVSDKNPALNVLLIYPVHYHVIIYMGTWHFIHETNLLYNLKKSEKNLVIRIKSRFFDALNAVISLEMEYDIEYYMYFVNYFKSIKKLVNLLPDHFTEDINPFLMWLFLERLFISDDRLNDDVFEEVCIRFPYLKDLHEMNQFAKGLSPRLNITDRYSLLQCLQHEGFTSIQQLFTTMFSSWKIRSRLAS